MNFEMKHNGSRIFNGTAGPPQQTSLHHLNNHHLNPNPFVTKSIHHLNNLNGFNYSTGSNQPNSSFVHLNKSHHPFSNYHYLTPGSNYHHYYHPYPLDSKGLYRINSALNLDHIEFETNLKREFGSVSSIGALSNNYPHHAAYSTNPNAHHHANAVAPLHSNQEHLLSFYSILKEFKRQNLENHQPPGGKSGGGFVTSSSNKIHDYLRARSEMSNADLVTNGNTNLAKGSNYDKLAHSHLHEASPHKKLFPSFSVDGAFNSKLITSNHPYLVTTSNHHHHASPSPYHPANELSASASLSAYHSSNCKLTNLTNLTNNHNNHHHSNAASLIGSNLALDDCVQPSPRVKKKLSYKIWEISKSEKNLKSKQPCKMSGESSSGGKPDAGSSTVDGSSTRAIFKKFTRIGSSKNVSSSSNSNASSGEQGTIQEEYRSLNQAVSTTHLDDPEVRFEEKLRKKGRQSVLLFLCKLQLLL